MDITQKIETILCEASTELFHNWWGRTTQLYIRDGVVLWSPSWEFPPGTEMSEEDIDEARRRGYVIIPWK